MPWQTALLQLEKHFMCNGSNFVVENWKFKYVNARIDMRTGYMRLEAGNDRSPRTYADEVQSQGGDWLAAAREVMLSRVLGTHLTTWGSESMVSCSMRTLEYIAAAAVAADRNARRST